MIESILIMEANVLDDINDLNIIEALYFLLTEWGTKLEELTIFQDVFLIAFNIQVTILLMTFQNSIA